jgi:RNA polymerase sigma factor (sigma-70 family)
MEDEAKLLGRFVEENDQAAFTELVRRHVNLVYAAALRQVGGDAQLAEEVTQGVFLALARTAPKLIRHSALSGWLYTSTRFLAAKSLRAHQRWQARQQEAHIMQNLLSDDGANAALEWCDLRPVIDEAMHELPASDREVLLLRYFEGRPLADLSAKYGLAQNAARMRVDRALERLRLRLARRGITSTAGALGVALAVQPVVAPPGLAAAAASLSLASLAAGGGAATGLSLFALMNTTKISVGAAILALSWLGYVSYQNSQLAAERANDQRQQNLQVRKLREEKLSLEDANRSLTETIASSPLAPTTPEPAPFPSSTSPDSLALNKAALEAETAAGYAKGFLAAFPRTHAAIFQKLGMSPAQQDIYVQMRLQHALEVNRISSSAAPDVAGQQETAALVAAITGTMWDRVRATFGDVMATGLQEFDAAWRQRPRAAAGTVAPNGTRTVAF